MAADEPQRHRIQVACPECGHVQTEPALVVSTQCRACRSHFQVEDGKGVVRKHSVARLAKPRREPDPEPPPAAKPQPPIPPRRAAPPRRPLLLRLIQRPKPPREVLCFHCQHPFKAIAEAQSSQCPKCGCYVSLIDHDLIENWNRAIETRGNVVIRKTGSFTGASLRCHHLTVHGALSGPVECSGDLVIRSSGKIHGTIHCRHLRVEKSARVEFLHPVTASTASIDGEVRGQITCSGTVTLEKRARLHGLLRCPELIVKAGATHSGTYEPTQPQV